MALKVLYKVGTREAYMNLSSHQSNALYWLNDVRELRLGDDLYSGGVRMADSYDKLPSCSLAAEGVLYICEDTGNGYVVDSTYSNWIHVVHGVDGDTIGFNTDGLMEVKAVPIAKVTGLEERLQAIEKTAIETIPVKGSDEISVAEDGTLGLVAVPMEKVTDLSDRLESLQTQIDTILDNPDAEGAINSINEFTKYIEEHGEVAEGFRADIEANKTAIEELAAANDALIPREEAKTISELVQYEITDTPLGTLIDYRDTEIRIMCPANVAWEKQNVGAGGDANTHYITFKTYAPSDDAVGYIEHLNGQADTDILTDFNTDKYGRRYQPTWLGVAKYDESTDTWTYYGASSSESRYIGWDYQIDWYNADGVMIASDSIRINLANEGCYSSIDPYYLGEINAALAEMEDSYTWGEI